MELTTLKMISTALPKINWGSLINLMSSTIVLLGLFAQIHGTTVFDLINSANDWLGVPSRWVDTIANWFADRQGDLRPSMQTLFIIFLVFFAHRAAYKNERVATFLAFVAAIDILSEGKIINLIMIALIRFFFEVALTWLYNRRPELWELEHYPSVSNVLLTCLTPFLASPFIALGFILNARSPAPISVRITSPVEVRTTDCHSPSGSITASMSAPH